MRTTRALDPALARQLKRLAIEPAIGPTTPAAWAGLLERLNEHCLHLADDRALLNRSLELSTAEMDGLRRKVEHQRDGLSSVIGTIGHALAEFGAVVQSDSSSGQVGLAKAQFAARLQTILKDSDIGDAQTSEVSLIRSNLARLADQLVVLLADTAERAVLKKELEVARAVQQLLVPADSVLERPRMQTAALFEPATECGGDWWSVQELADGRVATLVGDVTGHGVASAIITGAAKAACELAIELTGGKLDAGELLRLMNRALFRAGRQQLLMSCIVTVLDPATHELALANAGHPNPFLIRQGVIHPLLAEGAPLGAAADHAFTAVQVRVEPGDVLVGFTDGIVESENHRGEPFTERRLRAICQRAASGGARAVRDAVVEALATFRADVPLNDDLTLVATSFR